MRRPSFQFYPDDWSSNSNLKRCTHEEKGIWIDVMCVLHDQDEYGIARWPLAEIAQAVGTTKAKLKRLVEKGVLKGADAGEKCAPMVFVPRSGRKNGDPVTLIEEQEGPLWYSSRMVLDEYKRMVRGGIEAAPNGSPDASPKGGIGEGIDDTLKGTPDPSPSRAGASSSSPSSSSHINNTPNPPAGGEDDVDDDAGEDANEAKPKRERKPRIQLKTFIENCRSAGENAISGYRPLMTYIEETGLPMEFVQLAWDEFKRNFGPGGKDEARMQADWRRHFLNFVEKNYLRLWAARVGENGNEYFLTTQGLQAQALHRRREGVAA